MGFVLAALLAGCSGYTPLNYESYPPHLQYPQRSDYLVVETKNLPSELRSLPGPGELDASIRAAAVVPDPDKKGQMSLAPGVFDPAKLDKAKAKELDKAIKQVFGKPYAPQVGPAEGEEGHEEYLAARNQVLGEMEFSNVAALEDLELDEKTLKRGSKLYRRHCLHCHGLAGDGRGPTGPWVHPHPRDYRSGEFKFISTAQLAKGRKPRRDDLVRVLHQGIDGTSMPAFGLLPEFELRYLANYVMFLSIRGEVEFQTMVALLSEKSDSQEAANIHERVNRKTAETLIYWARSNDAKPMAAPAYTEPSGEPEEKRKALHASISAGHQLFVKAGCLGCHTDYGRQATYRRDAWGTLVRPFNLTTNQYRGGRRPIDLYWRFKGGIVPSQMPAPTGLKDEEYWQLVDFVQALPYPAMLPDDVRKTVYGSGESGKADKQASAR